MPLRTKLAAALHALGLDPKTTEFHHEPPLGLRPRNADDTDWEPAANDPAHITPVDAATHKTHTFGVPAIPRSGDIAKIEHVKRLNEAHADFQARVARMLAPTKKPKPRFKWPKRPFPKRH